MLGPTTRRLAAGTLAGACRVVFDVATFWPTAGQPCRWQGVGGRARFAASEMWRERHSMTRKTRIAAFAAVGFNRSQGSLQLLLNPD